MQSPPPKPVSEPSAPMTRWQGTMIGNGFVTVLGGTSFATPFVAGAAALVWGHPDYRNLTALEVRYLLLHKTTQVPGLAGQCSTGGRLDLAFLQSALP